MSKPKPRKSTLAGQSVTDPKPSRPLAKTATEKQKITIYINPEISNTARGVYMARVSHGGPRSWSAWVEQAIAAKIEADLELLNQMPEQAPPGTVPLGRLLP